MAKMSQEELVRTLSKTALDILQGVVSYNTAVAQMDIAAITESLTDELLVGLSCQAFELVKQPEPKWQPALALQTLLYVCIDNLPEPPPSAVQAELAWRYVGMASRALWFVPDPSVYKQATERGLVAVEVLRDEGSTGALGSLLHALGTLNLDPYGANRSHHVFEQEMQIWRARAVNGETWNHVNYYDISADGYPDLQQALESACKFYREAAALKEGQDRARTLKALAQSQYQLY